MKYADILKNLKKTVERTIAAFDTLIERYESLIEKGAKNCKINGDASVCPLCAIYRETHCRLCPWRIYGPKRKCGNSANQTPRSNLKRTQEWKARYIREMKRLGLLE